MFLRKSTLDGGSYVGKSIAFESVAFRNEHLSKGKTNYIASRGEAEMYVVSLQAEPGSCVGLVCRRGIIVSSVELSSKICASCVLNSGTACYQTVKALTSDTLKQLQNAIEAS